ncbi:MAG: 3-deoxy-7-phosphoheptulonate synthase [Clostridiales bacterium]|nr:3-deoxy-7-phosphoheptulonate synthase [Clostridiales bacterium]
MIIILKNKSDKMIVNELKNEITKRGLQIIISNNGENDTLGVVGDLSKISKDEITKYNVVEDIVKVKESYKKSNRIMHSEDSIIDVSGVKIGDGSFKVIAGPCSIESKDQIIDISKKVKLSGASMIRGGAFKPRTSPYSFQGLGANGLELLIEAKKVTKLPIVTEIMSQDKIDLFENVDLIQVGTRNMQNFDLLKELGKINKPILLKRGMSATLDELLMSAEYIMAGGNSNVILCERGIRTFETSMRNTLDISAVPMLKKKTHLPVIIDPSHAAGFRFMVEPLTMASVAAGADGAIIEVHNDPDNALCDGAQSLTPDMFDNLMRKANKVKEAIS